MNIKVEIKNSYGRDLIYPVCENAKLFAQLVGQKTLGDIADQKSYSEGIIDLIKKLGFEVEVVTTQTL